MGNDDRHDGRFPAVAEPERRLQRSPPERGPLGWNPDRLMHPRRGGDCINDPGEPVSGVGALAAGDGMHARACGRACGRALTMPSMGLSLV